MWRLTWRQARPNLAVCVGLLLAFTAFAVVTERAMASYVAQNGIDSCVAATQDCRVLGDAFRDRFDGLRQSYQWFTFVPVLIGAFWGGPLIAREIEQGTHRLVWTQSVTRGRWLATKVGLYLGAAVILSAILTWLMTWWQSPMQNVQGGGTVGPAAGDRISPNVFSFEGVAPVAYTVFAFAVGALAGVMFKKVVPAILATIVLYTPLRIVMATETVRGYLITPLTVTYPAAGPSPRAGLGDWNLEHTLVSSTGQPIDWSTVEAVCPHQFTPACLPAGSRFIDRYQSLARFWPLQLIEAGVFVGVAALCLAVAVRLTLRRTS